MKKTILVSTAISALFLGGAFSMATAQTDVTDGETQKQGKPTSLLPDSEQKASVGDADKTDGEASKSTSSTTTGNEGTEPTSDQPKNDL